MKCMNSFRRKPPKLTDLEDTVRDIRLPPEDINTLSRLSTQFNRNESVYPNDPRHPLLGAGNLSADEFDLLSSRQDPSEAVRLGGTFYDGVHRVSMMNDDDIFDGTGEEFAAWMDQLDTFRVDPRLRLRPLAVPPHPNVFLEDLRTESEIRDDPRLDTDFQEASEGVVRPPWLPSSATYVRAPTQRERSWAERIGLAGSSLLGVYLVNGALNFLTPNGVIPMMMASYHRMVDAPLYYQRKVTSKNMKRSKTKSRKTKSRKTKRKSKRRRHL